jgi:hypothetical protein
MPENKEGNIRKPRDYFAELYVAALMADAGWNVYFPHRDRGMDFIVSKTGDDGQEIIRPVQVKGKYPEIGKSDKATYGYVGRLNQRHPLMVLAIPFFETAVPGPALFVAYMPESRIKPCSRGARCEPATFKSGRPHGRRHYRRYLDAEGLAQVALSSWA